LGEPLKHETGPIRKRTEKARGIRGVGRVHSSEEIQDNKTCKERRDSTLVKQPKKGRTRRLGNDLRTTESRDSVQELQRKLSLKAKSERKFRFYALYDKVYRRDILKEAWRRVKENKGAGGIDGIEIEQIAGAAEEFLAGISGELREETYRPQPLKRVYIPKADGNKRPLSIPTVKDRVVQAALKLVIEPIFEADFEENSYGFREGRSTRQAAKEVRKYLNWGYAEVIETDIKDCFGTIPHKELLEAVASRVVDRRILSLIKRMLKAGVLEEGRVEKEDNGTPQGGVVSPLLANIYLDALDKGWKPLNKAARLIRYADDLIILSRHKSIGYRRKLEEIVKGMKMELKQEKTRELRAQEGFDFVGYAFIKARSRRTGKEAAYSYPSQKAERKVKERVREIVDYRRPIKVQEVIKELTPVIRGWVNYHRWGNASRVFGKVKWYVEQRVRKFMRRRRGKSGYGYQEYPCGYLYKTLGLYNDYRIDWTNA
jgi:group II intron reverse transcriptase/maturase